VEQARLSLDRAERDYNEAVASSADPDEVADLAAAVAVAENQLAVAEAQLAELTAPVDTSTIRRALDDARASEQHAQSDLSELTASLGFRVPRGEVVFVPTLPRQVGQVTVKVGDTPQSVVLDLTATNVQIDIALSAQEKQLVNVGDAVRLDDAVSGVNLTGEVTAVAESSGTDGVLPGRFHARIEPKGGDPRELVGLNLRVTIPVKSTGGPVLAVPVAALVTDASGQVAVRVRRVDGDRVYDEDVRVLVGLSADGFAQVTPVDSPLTDGDLVIVGHEW
jgi:hypothetical protein